MLSFGPQAVHFKTTLDMKKEVIELSEYLKKKHNGVKERLSEDLGVKSSQNINNYLVDNLFVLVDGVLYRKAKVQTRKHRKKEEKERNG